ncbi:isopentenyl-diphosphate Delta-isomerase [Actinocorallia lasiicapitis]
MAEQIVLLDEAGHSTGTAPKAESHHGDTPFHLAFSSYLVDEEGRILLTQRAHAKRSFPSVWTNSACGHPAPGETLREAATRRIRTELGLDAREVTLILPEFVYRAEQDGIVEFEWCPVVRARVTGEPVRDPAEVEALEWRTWAGVMALRDDPRASPWFLKQMEQLVPLGSPLEWPAADPALPPPAITW